MIGTKNGVTIEGGRFVVRGKRRELFWGFSAFKLFNYVAQHFAGHGDEFRSLGGSIHGALNIVKAFISSRQALVGREDVWFRLFSQTGDGEPGSWNLLDNIDQGMFGSPPHEPNPENSSARLWDYNALRRGHRPEGVTTLMAHCLEWFFDYSEKSGACFEIVVDATVKHMDGMTPGTIDHMCRQMAREMRGLQDSYPRACIIMSTDNEANAHNRVEQSQRDVNMRGVRFYRWKDDDGGLRQSFDDPGGTFNAEQWPEGIVIVDDGGGSRFQYECGGEPDRFKMAAIHPPRKGNPQDWRDISWFMEALTRDARGMPVGFTESMYYVDNSSESLERANRIYRNKNGWQANAQDQMLFYQRGVGKVNYNIIHTEKDVQGSIDWPMDVTPLEVELAAFFESGQIQPPPPPPEFVSYDHVAESIYRQILLRPGDLKGRAFYDEQMRLYYQGDHSLGLSYDNVRDAMLMSDEYANEFKR